MVHKNDRATPSGSGPGGRPATTKVHPALAGPQTKKLISVRGKLLRIGSDTLRTRWPRGRQMGRYPGEKGNRDPPRLKEPGRRKELVGESHGSTPISVQEGTRPSGRAESFPLSSKKNPRGSSEEKALLSDAKASRYRSGGNSRL